VESEIGSYEKAIEARDLAEKEWIRTAAAVKREAKNVQIVANLNMKKIVEAIGVLKGG